MKPRSVPAPELTRRILGLLIETVTVLDSDGTIRWTNLDFAPEGPLGYEPEQLVSTSAFDYVHPDDLPLIAKVHETLLATPGAAVSCEARLRASDGSYQNAEGVAYNLLDDPDVRAIVMCTRNITPHVMALEVTQQSMEALLDQAADLALLYDPAGRLLHANQRMVDELGWSDDDVATIDAFLEHVEADDRSDVSRHVGRARVDGPTPVIARLRDSSERRRVLALRVAAAGGVTDGIAITGHDITEQIDREHMLRHRSLHDPLTGLPNRALLQDRFDQALRRIDRVGQLVLVYVDIDHFKEINDENGHEIGDAVLAAVAERLQGVVRPDDTVARIGGDEFVVLATSSDDRAFTDVPTRLMRALAPTIDISGHEIRVTASLGVVSTTTPDDSPELLLRAADAAMYRAKRAGRNRIGYDLGEISLTSPSVPLDSP